MNHYAVSVINLSRSFETTVGFFRREKRTIEALKQVSFNINYGEIFGLVGPNGAGKTSLVKILTTLLLPNSGKATVLGYDASSEEQKIRPNINFIFGGERGLYWRLSGMDNLLYFSDLYKVERKLAKKRSESLLKMVGLWDRRDERVEVYSKGMKQRLHIAKALVNEPKVMFLDEPTIGLDPVASRMIRDLVKELQKMGITIFLTSHYMFEMETLCDRIGVLKKGKILTIDSPKGLMRFSEGNQVVELQVFGGFEDFEKKMQNVLAVTSMSISTGSQSQTIRVMTKSPSDIIAHIKSSFQGIDLSRLIVRAPNLEDAYINLIEETITNDD